MSIKEPLEYWPQSELVSAQWVKEHLQDNHVKFVEVYYGPSNRKSHDSVPGSTLFLLDDEIDRTSYKDNVQDEKYNTLLNKIGVKDEKTMIILYSEYNNWFAAIVFWMLKHFGHDNVKLLERVKY